MEIIMIFAICRKNVIGDNRKKNNLPWNEPEDMKYFRETTKNKIVIAGTKTFDDVLIKMKYSKNVKMAYQFSRSLYKNFDELKEVIRKDHPDYTDPVYVIGGAETYMNIAPFADSMIVSLMPYGVVNDGNDDRLIKLNFKHLESLFDKKELLCELPSATMLDTIEVVKYSK